jgi:hypothetical protein
MLLRPGNAGSNTVTEHIEVLARGDPTSHARSSQDYRLSVA